MGGGRRDSVRVMGERFYVFRFHMGVQLDSIFKLVAYYLFSCSLDHSVYVGKEKIRFQENTFGKLCSHCRFVLFVFAALFDIAIVRSNTMKKFFPNPLQKGSMYE